MKNLLFIPVTLLFLLLGNNAFGQQQKFTVEGVVTDENQEALTGATVVLLQARDSVMAGYGISGKEGQFQLKRIKAGDYLLQITYIGYQNYSHPLHLGGEEKDPVRLDPIRLSPASEILDEVVVKSEHIPIRLNKDTIEYNAAAFQTKPNAVVEELLKKLPGIEVERDGTIKAQGKEVENVYVDGKEFFGTDPQMATKNLPADAIDKVQVFDKKSEMAEFTGIDDGNREKTINLALKEGKKKGYFGNISAGYGNMDRYEGKANINHFNKKMQLSAIGSLNNVNEQAFSINDYIQFMGGLQNLMSGGGGTMTLNLNSMDAGIPLGMGLSDGFVDTGAGGLNFNYDFSQKTELQSSYFFNHIRNTIDQEINRQNFLPGKQSFHSTLNNNLVNENANHRLNLKLEHQIDSFQTIRLRSSLSYNDGNSFSNNLIDNFNTENRLENRGIRTYDANASALRFNASLLHKKRFRKLGRVFVTDLSLSTYQDERATRLGSVNTFHPDFPEPSFSDTLNQRQLYENQRINYGARFSYIEPLGKRRYLEFNYSHNSNTDELDKDFFDLSNEQQTIETYNPQLSNHYNSDYLYNTGGISFKLNRKKYQWTAGLRLQHSQLKGNLFSDQSKISNDYLDWLPRFNLNYDFTNSKNLSVNYRTEVGPPSIAQLNPIIDNSDPLNIYAGNSKLRPEYSHNLGLNYFSFDQFSFTNFFVALNAAYTKNDIVNSRTLDSLFRQTTMPENVDNNFALRSFIGFGTPLRFIGTKVNFEVNANYEKGFDFLNGIENRITRYSNSFDLSLENRKKKTVDIIAGGKITYNLTRYAINKDFNQHFIRQTYYVDLMLDFAKSWSLSSSFDLNLYSAEAFGEAERIPIWRATLSKYILENRGAFRFSCVDILNRNVGLNRSSTLNYLQEERIQSLGRYFILGFTWSLSKFGKKGGTGIDIQMDRRR